jgi:DNA-binding MarR family transcriptional regulator/GNAT superfamily N-acetyltransferase
MALSSPSLRQQVEAVRRFNRFYTGRIGVLQEGLLNSPFSLTEVRVLYEIAHSDRPTATELAKALNLDVGYLSRILQRFSRRRFITRTASKTDARQTHLALTARGRDTLAPLERLSQDEVAAMLKALTPADQRRVVEAMGTIQTCLDTPDEPGPGANANARARTAAAATAVTNAQANHAPADAPYTLRPHKSGDMGWIVHRHAALYTQEYGWTNEFEALAAEIVAHFIRNFDPARERCWMAERDDAIVGSVMLVKQSATVAKLRLLLVEPSARGLGLGKRLVDECVQFARQAGYKRITLWTQSNLLAARGIYKRAGFELLKQEHRPAFGADLVSETWELAL